MNENEKRAADDAAMGLALFALFQHNPAARNRLRGAIEGIGDLALSVDLTDAQIERVKKGLRALTVPAS